MQHKKDKVYHDGHLDNLKTWRNEEKEINHSCLHEKERKAHFAGAPQNTFSMKSS